MKIHTVKKSVYCLPVHRMVHRDHIMNHQISSSPSQVGITCVFSSSGVHLLMQSKKKREEITIKKKHCKYPNITHKLKSNGKFSMQRFITSEGIKDVKTAAGLTCLSLKERFPLVLTFWLCFIIKKFFFRFFSLLLVLANGFSLLLFLTNSFLSVRPAWEQKKSSVSGKNINNVIILH